MEQDQQQKISKQGNVFFPSNKLTALKPTPISFFLYKNSLVFCTQATFL